MSMGDDYLKEVEHLVRGPGFQLRVTLLSICSCKHPMFENHLTLGKLYTVYPRSIQPGNYLCGGCHQVIPVHTILAEQDGSTVRLPLDVFEMDEHKRVSWKSGLY